MHASYFFSKTYCTSEGISGLPSSTFQQIALQFLPYYRSKSIISHAILIVVSTATDQRRFPSPTNYAENGTTILRLCSILSHTILAEDRTAILPLRSIVSHAILENVGTVI